MSKSENIIEVYKSNDGEVSFDVNVMDNSVWLSQADMVILFERDQSVIARHIRNIFKENELEKNSVYAKYAYTATDGKTYEVDHYSLDMVISVGYRVKSQRGVDFRRWATQILKKYMINGYAINEYRISAIENKLEMLTIEIRAEVKTELQNIYKVLAQIAGNPQPIVINNQIQLTSDKLENKILEVLDEIIKSSKDPMLNNTLQEVKKDIKKVPDSPTSRSKVIRFFKAIGDDESDTGKAIRGAGITGKLITKLIQLGEKLL